MKDVSGESLVAELSTEVPQSQDEAVLAYYGKRQQLRVSAAIPPPRRRV